MTYYAPGLSHNHVHFVFPSSMVLIAKRYLKPNSFLFRLLEPHSKFTERINYQVLSIKTMQNRSIAAFTRATFFRAIF